MTGRTSDDAAVGAVAERITGSLRADGVRRPHLVGIDGRSGAGKTTLARELARQLRRAGHGVSTLHLDGVYPGWDGLRAAVDLLVDELLPRLRDGQPASWPGWDWDHDRPGRTLSVPARDVVLVEGVGAGARGAVAFLDLMVWLDAPTAVRHGRAMQRDGDGYAPHWQRWAAQEEAYLAREEPARSADLVVDTDVGSVRPGPRVRS